MTDTEPTFEPACAGLGTALFSGRVSALELPMDKNRNYYEDRAEAELALAQRSTDPAAVKAHYELAGYYLDVVYGDGTAEALISGASVEPPPPVKPSLLAQLRKLGVIILNQSPS